MFSATRWIPRGYAAEFPEKFNLDDEEMDRISKLAKLQLEDAKEDLETAMKDTPEQEDKSEDESEETLEKDADLKEYDLEHYDEEEDEGAGERMGIFNNIKSLAYHAPGEEDPYITLPDDTPEDDEREELQILPTDNLILASRTEDDVSYLEVYVYDNEVEEEDDDDEVAKTNAPLYVHHDFMLPSFPLCIEWLDYKVGKAALGGQDQPGNFAAIGTFEPQIEIWNLDVVDSVYPDLILGEKPDSSVTAPVAGGKKKKKKGKKSNDEYHVDAVLSLSHNKLQRNLLASASADTTVKLWDLNNGSCAKSFNFSEGKVSSVAFNPVEASVMLTGGYDKCARVTDLRTEGIEGQRLWKVDSDIESAKWDSNGYNFYVATELGAIHKFDARNEGKTIWSLQAHDAEVSTFDINNFADGYMVTGSSDKTVKLWSLNGEKGPSMILSRDLDVGRVFTTSFGPDPEVFGHVVVGGSTGSLQVWDTLTNRTVREVIGKKTQLKLREYKKERIARIVDDDEVEDDDEDESSPP